MPRKKKTVTKAMRAALRVPPQVKGNPDKVKELDEYLRESIPKVIQNRDKVLDRVEKWRKTIRGERAAVTRRRTGASNLSVPLTIWARTAVRARLTESVIENRPLVSVEAVPGRAGADTPSNQTLANSIGRFLETEILSERGLRGKEAIEKVCAEVVDLGSAAMKVVPSRDIVRKAGPLPRAVGGEPTTFIERGRVQWKFISLLDLLYHDGYGTDTQAMPYVGHQLTRVWSQIRAFAELGHYDKDALEEIEAFYDENEGQKPAAIREHDIAELYLDWDIDGDGVEEALIIDWHIRAGKRLRMNWSPFVRGRRPILVTQFDLPDDLNQLRGQGVSEKLEGVQDEVDAVHNIAIEAGKRGTAHLIVIKQGTRAEEEFGGEEDVLPGDVIVTDTPDEDITTVPLGDASAALAALQVEEHSRIYVTRILGLDESKVGNVESGKRVTAAVGMATMREGRMIIRAALSSLEHLFSEAAYITLDLYKHYIPEEGLRAALTPDEVDAVMSTVFSASDASVRSSFLVRVNAQDAAIMQETKKQELLIINQALFPFYDRVQQYILALVNPELPPAAQKPLLMLIERMERGMEALLNTVESIKSPEELLVGIGDITKALEGVPGMEDPIPEEGGSEAAAGTLVGDLGGEVA